MSEWHSTVTARGQVTLPVAIQRLLGVAPGDKIAFVADGDQVHIVRIGSVVERTAGALKSQERPLTAEALREAAECAIAQDVPERVNK